MIRASLIAAAIIGLLAACAEPDRESDTASQTPAATPALTSPLGPHTPARVLGGEIIALSQILPPAGEDGSVSGDVESQTGAALRLLSDALAEQGLGLGDVAQVTVHLVAEPDGSLDTEAVARAWRRSFATRLQPAAPARTIVGVSALPAPGARVSLTVLALRPAQPQTGTETE
ncbi:MAG: Rid family hydrolase [Oceanicaulis sp.]